MEWALLAVAVLAILLVAGAHRGSAAAIARIERKLDMLLRDRGIDPRQHLQMSERVKQLANDPAGKIEAIKAYREETGAGLAEAKDAIEMYIREGGAS